MTRKRNLGIKYWVFQGVPNQYRIEDAIHELEIELWDVKGHDVRDGDKAIIWRSMKKGEGRRRGVIAFGDIESNPSWRSVPEHIRAYYLPGHESDANGVFWYVDMRYIVPSGAPLWDGAPGSEILKELNVYGNGHGVQGGVFTCTEALYDAVWEACGGEPFDRPAPVAPASVQVSTRRQPENTEVTQARKALEYAQSRRVSPLVEQNYRQAYERALAAATRGR